MIVDQHTSSVHLSISVEAFFFRPLFFPGIENHGLSPLNHPKQPNFGREDFCISARAVRAATRPASLTGETHHYSPFWRKVEDLNLALDRVHVHCSPHTWRNYLPFFIHDPSTDICVSFRLFLRGQRTSSFPEERCVARAYHAACIQSSKHCCNDKHFASMHSC